MEHVTSRSPLGIVIVNYRTPDLTFQCLHSLEPEVQSLPGTRVVVVDSHSGDGSVETVKETIEKEGWGRWVEVKPLGENRGFAYAVNRGVESLSEADYLLFLNSDTVVHKGCLRYCWETMEKHPPIGVLSCLQQDREGSAHTVARRFPTLSRQLVSALGLPYYFPRLFGWANLQDPGWDRVRTKRDVDWLSGAFLFTRALLLKKIGGLDEDFFLYGEDIEFCQRVWKAGFRCHYDPAVRITHFGGRSSDPSRISPQRRTTYEWASRYLVQEKCCGPLARATLRLFDLILLALRLLIHWIRGESGGPRARERKEALSILMRPVRV